MILLVGKNGQLGREFIDFLTTNNIRHVAYGKDQIDISNYSEVERVLSTYKGSGSYLINCAAFTDVEQAEIADVKFVFPINSDGPRNLAKISKKFGFRFIHFSTDYVFSGEKSSPYLENDLCLPKNVYGMSKLLGESNVMEEYPENSYIFRTSWVYSKYGSNFVEKVISAGIKGTKLQIVKDQVGQPTWTGEIVKAIVGLTKLHSPIAPGIYHYSSSGECSWFEFSNAIFEIAKLPLENITPIASSQLPSRVKRPSYTVLSHEKWENLISSGVNLHMVPNWKKSLEDSGIVGEILRSLEAM